MKSFVLLSLLIFVILNKEGDSIIHTWKIKGRSCDLCISSGCVGMQALAFLLLNCEYHCLGGDGAGGDSGILGRRRLCCPSE